MTQQLKTQLDSVPQLQKHLFEHGFLLADGDICAKRLSLLDGYPFYGNWSEVEVGAAGFRLWLHKGAKLHKATRDGKTVILIGHAYNPFTMLAQEEEIIEELLTAYGTPTYQEKVNQLTGVFFLCVMEGKKAEFQLDASGMQYACYGRVGKTRYIASHMRLAGDIWPDRLRTDGYVEQLVDYRWYRYMLGNYLPGDLTCYKSQKRVIPNTAVTLEKGRFTIARFYPEYAIQMAESEESYNQVIRRAAGLLQNTMELIPQKWERPAISLTGGIDSNTTFAVANGLYDRYVAFSYVSMHRESVDAEKAKEISSRFGVKHTTYTVPKDNGAFPHFDLYKAIFEHNDGDVGRAKDDDTRKKITLIQSDVCDVEVKSWISETIRAYAYKYYGRTKFPESLRPRDYTSLYKIFLGRRDLAVQTDRRFARYLKKTDLKAHLFNYDETDFFVWEMEHGGKCGLNIGVMRSCFDITIPYNNRALLDLLLRVPLDMRISDQHHMDMKRLMNPELADMGIRVVNLNETTRRKKAIGAYYTVNTHLPL